MKSEHPSLPVAVIGAGPVGLAAAMHLLERGFSPLILESSNAIASTFEATRHVRLFSPWRYNVDRAAVRMLATSGWRSPEPELLPTAGEMIDAYLSPLAQLPQIKSALRLERRVVAITREGYDKAKTQGREHAAFLVRTDGPHGEEEHRVFAVIDASGTWSSPNPIGANGLPAHGEAAFASRIAYGMPDVGGAQRAHYANRHVLVVGAGHSAIGTLLALASLADEAPETRISWAIRGDNLARILGGGANDGLPARGALGQSVRRLMDAGRLTVLTNLRIEAIHEERGALVVEGAGKDGSRVRVTGIDEIVCATGSRPDHRLAAELRLKTDPWLESTDALAPLIDPNVHSCGTVRPHGHRELAHPEPGYFAVGAKSYGRAPNFLLATGYEQVRSVAAALAGDIAAADDVQLELPETGVCSTRPAPAVADKGCCGGQASKAGVAELQACCVQDEESLRATGVGCSALILRPPLERTRS